MSLMKPRSNMRSASSRISTCTARRSNTRCFAKSMMRPGRADQDIHALFELMALLVVVDAAEGEAERQAGVRAEHFGVAMDLHRQLARWSNDQCARRVEIARGHRLGADEPRIHRDQERCGFPCSRLCLSGDVETGQRLRQRLRLNRRAAFERGVGQTLLQRFRQVKTGERKLC
jgi:hypothetical protein